MEKICHFLGQNHELPSVPQFPQLLSSGVVLSNLRSVSKKQNQTIYSVKKHHKPQSRY